MLKISQAEPGVQEGVLRLEGRVIGPWVTELQKSCEAVLARAELLQLHLAGVEFMDPQGVALLISLRARGAELLECPPFAAEQLRMAGEVSNPRFIRCA